MKENNGNVREVNSDGEYQDRMVLNHIGTEIGDRQSSRHGSRRGSRSATKRNNVSCGTSSSFSLVIPNRVGVYLTHR